MPKKTRRHTTRTPAALYAVLENRHSTDLRRLANEVLALVDYADGESDQPPALKDPFKTEAAEYLATSEGRKSASRWASKRGLSEKAALLKEKAPRLDLAEVREGISDMYRELSRLEGSLLGDLGLDRRGEVPESTLGITRSESLSRKF